MDHENELSDIMLGNDLTSKTKKTKRLLLVIALFALLFIIVLLIMKFTNKKDNQDIPTTFINKDELTSIINKNISSSEKNISTNEVVVEEFKPTEIKIETISETNILPKINEINNTQKPTTKTTVSNKTKKNTQEKLQNTQKVVKNSTYYIQVGSVANGKPSSDFISKIEQKNYKVTQYETIVKSTKVTKILVGPYLSENQARSDLLNVKSDIAKDAFIYKMPN